MDRGAGYQTQSSPGNCDLSMNSSDFSAWISSASTDSLKKALESVEMAEEKLREIIRKKTDLKIALLMREYSDKDSEDATTTQPNEPEAKTLEAVQPQKDWSEGDRASLVCDISGEHVLWPGTITDKKTIVRVRVIEGGKVKMQDCPEGYVSPLEQEIETERDGTSFDHWVKFTVTMGSTIYTQPFCKTSKEATLAVGEILEWEFTIKSGNTRISCKVPGFPCWYSMDLDNDGGRESQIESSRLQAALPTHKAPTPLEWPASGAMLEQVGSSRLIVKNGNPDGMAMFVKVYKAEDAHEVSPTPLAKIFCSPGETGGAEMPGGFYHLRIAAGYQWLGELSGKRAAWYGEQYLFGPAGVYLIDTDTTILQVGTKLTSSISTYGSAIGTLKRVPQGWLKK